MIEKRIMMKTIQTIMQYDDKPESYEGSVKIITYYVSFHCSNYYKFALPLWQKIRKGYVRIEN